MNSVCKHKFLYSILGVILVLILITFFCYQFFFRTSKSPPPNAMEIKAQQLLESANNPIQQLSPQEVKIKEAQIKSTEKNPTVKLTPEQIRQKQLQLSQ